MTIPASFDQRRFLTSNPAPDFRISLIVLGIVYAWLMRSAFADEPRLRFEPDWNDAGLDDPTAEFNDHSEFRFPPRVMFRETAATAVFHSQATPIQYQTFENSRADRNAVSQLVNSPFEMNDDGPRHEAYGRMKKPLTDDAGNTNEYPLEATDGEATIWTDFSHLPDVPNDSKHEAAEAGSPNGTDWPISNAPPLIHQTDDDLASLKDLNEGRSKLNLRRLAKLSYQNYRSDESAWSWLPGTGDDFGWFSLTSTTYQPRGQKSGFGGLFNIHWLGGPTSYPLPSRLYDFGFGFQTRDSLSHRFSYDLSTSIGAYSDFEGSARKGVRFPSHAVGMIHVDSSLDLIFGADFLDRDDYSVLPVFGISLHDLDFPDLRLDLIFPRPRIEYALSSDARAYLSGQMGGGTWQVEFPDEREHVMTYRDYRLMLGFEKTSDSGALNALEFAYVFNRRLEFRDLPAAPGFDDAFVIQWVTRH